MSALDEAINESKKRLAEIRILDGMVAEAREREAVLVLALTSAQHAIYILEAHIDFIADGQQPEEHDGGCIALAKSQCRDALATVSDTAEKE